MERNGVKMNALEGRKFEKVCSIIEKYQKDQTKLIPILQEIQEVYRFLPEEIMTFVGSSLDINPAKIFGVATFYSHFTLKPKGKYIIKICDGTACHVKKSHSILEAINKNLGISEKNNTTKDMLFTLETVSCLGACGIAPVVVVNDDVYGQMTAERTIEVIDKIKKKEVELNENS